MGSSLSYPLPTPLALGDHTLPVACPDNCWGTASPSGTVVGERRLSHWLQGLHTHWGETLLAAATSQDLHDQVFAHREALPGETAFGSMQSSSGDSLGLKTSSQDGLLAETSSSAVSLSSIALSGRNGNLSRAEK